MILSFHVSPDKSQISYFLLCNYIDLFIPVAIPESDRLFNHAQSHQLAGDKGHTIWPGLQRKMTNVNSVVKEMYASTLGSGIWYL